MKCKKIRFVEVKIDLNAKILCMYNVHVCGEIIFKMYIYIFRGNSSVTHFNKQTFISPCLFHIHSRINKHFLPR